MARSPNSTNEIARRAGVARVTVYQHFESKLGLLDAIIGALEQRGNSAAVVTATMLPDAVEALRRAMAEGCRFWGSVHLLARKLWGLAAVDPEARSVLAEREQRRLALIAGVVERLASQGRLAPGCPPRQAVDALSVLTSFETFDQLSTGRGLSAPAVCDLLLLLCEVVVPAARPRAASAKCGSV